MPVKPVILYNRHKVRPETIYLIANAAPGALIPVEQTELDAFLYLQIDIPEDQPEVKTMREARRKGHGKEKDQREVTEPETPLQAGPGRGDLQADAEGLEQES